MSPTKKKTGSSSRSSARRPRAKFYNTWGGARAGAGRPPSQDSGETHVRRPPLASRWPVYVSFELVAEMPGLRNHRYASVVRRCLAAANAAGVVRVVHFAMAEHRLLLLVEAKDREALSQGMQGLGIRLARRLNKEAGRKGRVLADRFHAKILKTPREARDALCKVLRNHARQQGPAGKDDAVAGVDPYSSGAYFDGWRGYRPQPPEDPGPPPVAAARTWILSKGWRRHGLIGLDETPGS